MKKKKKLHLKRMIIASIYNSYRIKGGTAAVGVIQTNTCNCPPTTDCLITENDCPNSDTVKTSTIRDVSNNCLVGD